MGGSLGAGDRLSAGGRQGARRAQVAEPVVQTGDAQDQRRSPSPLHLHVHWAPLHRGLWEAVNGDVSKSTQGPVPTSYQLTLSLKTNGIFLALNTFTGGWSPRKRLDSSWPEKEFLERVSRKGSRATVPSGVPKCSPTSPSTCP